MISETQQEQASLYALGLLDADEASTFEREIRADTDVQAFVRETQETIARLAWAGDRAMQKPPPALRARVVAEVEALANRGNRAAATRTFSRPWALAALFFVCATLLGLSLVQRQRELDQWKRTAFRQTRALAEEKAARPAAGEEFAQISFCALEPTPAFKTGQPRAMVLWDAAHRQGKLRINRLAPPAEGKDYQLWTVEKGRKDAVSAGVVHVDADGTAEVPFQPVDNDGKPVAAVAISLEQAGGSPTNQGPILLLGKF